MTPEELNKLAATTRKHQQQFAHQINVCVGTGCQSSGSAAVLEALTGEVKKTGAQSSCLVRGSGCRGMCASGPLLSVDPEGVLYGPVTVEDAPDLVRSLSEGKLTRLVCESDSPFFTRQCRVVLENAGRIDPERIQDYIAMEGYSALARVVTEMSPGEVLEEITRSGLRGRGGAGYPTGLKWSTVAKARSEQKYVICNGDEGDPGAFMDRSVMEDDPHRIIEGMAIAAYAVGAKQGYIYVRAEYPLAIKRLKNALAQAKRDGFLGDGICGSSFSFTVDLRLGAGAFVCGEETALIASVEGRRGMPRPRPPYPAVAGLWGKPTLINNVETFGNIQSIIRKGADWFATIGTERSKGTKVFALTGRVANSGLIEVPMGITLREIVYEIGGGIPEGRRCKGVQTGGPSGGCIPEALLDRPVDYESLAELGSIMGSGGMIVIDETSCMVDVAKYFMEFCMTESCGKCVPCRTGTSQMHDLLHKITEGEASLDDLDLLQELCEVVRNTSLCGLGQSAPNPVLSTLRYFKDEYMAHIVDKQCPAGVCQMRHAVEV
ncbi:MAG: SLBB domain-containing protein [Candidatus Hydrogenedentes bacterium]|nr:SLBB domain-containing protein [Candidatus Hydrogenedentota bacterium]